MTATTYSRWSCPIHSTMNTAGQITNATFQTVLIPHHVTLSIPGASSPLQRVKAVPGRPMLMWWSKAVKRYCFLAFATSRTRRNPWDARSPLCVGLCDVLLGPHSSLPRLR